MAALGGKFATTGIAKQTKQIKTHSSPDLVWIDYMLRKETALISSAILMKMTQMRDAAKNGLKNMDVLSTLKLKWLLCLTLHLQLCQLWGMVTTTQSQQTR